MDTDLRLLATVAVLLLFGGEGTRAQEIGIAEDTQITSVAVDLPGDAGIDASELLEHVASRGPRFARLQGALSRLPFGAPAERYPFDPFELQRDKERVRRFMAEAGYLRASAEYVVTPAGEGAVRVEFVVTPGPPLIVRSISAVWADSTHPPDLEPSQAIAEARPRIELAPDARLDARALDPAALSIRRWLADRGHPFAAVTADTSVDTTASVADLVFRLDPGPRARVGDVSVEGNVRLSADELLAIAGVEQGAPYALESLQRGAQRLEQLDLIGGAAFSLGPGQAPDSSVSLVLGVREEPLRTIGGEVGYGSDTGFAADVRWSHRNVLGGGRTLTALVSGPTGLLAIDPNPERFIRGSLTLRQPTLARSLVSVTFGPFVELRDDYRDRSVEVGGSATFARRIGTLSSVALELEVSRRHIYEYHLGDVSGGVDLLEVLQLGPDRVANALGARIHRSVATVSASIGDLDSPTDPRRGYTIEPAISATVLPGLNTAEFVKADVRVAAYWPLTPRVNLAGRASAGKLFPFGKSVPGAGEEPLGFYFDLRDEVFTSGGAGEVRGWADRMLGPKFPRPTLVDLDPVTFESDRYTPLGGLTRVATGLELRFPISWLGDDFGGYTFIDGGRVWTSDTRYVSDDDPYGVSGFFWGTGVGIDYATPIGVLRLGVGYKLNPSVLDLADPDRVLDALLAGTPLESLEKHDIRRFRVHLALGRAL